MSGPLLSVTDLRTYFETDAGVVRAVDGVSFDVHPGEVLGLVGESGAGKSVVARSLLRLVDDPGRIVGGEVRFRDHTLVGFADEPDAGAAATSPLPRPEPSEAMLSESAMREEVRGSEVAIVFQDPQASLNPVISVGEQLREVIALNRDLDGRTAREVAVSMLREVEVPVPEERYHDYPHELSGGTCQRVLLAMALACEPSLVVADEPTAALDATVEGQILDLVRDLADRYDTSVLWVTHDMGVVAELCDRVAVMYAGSVVEQAPVDDCFYDPRHPYTEALLRSIPRPDRRVERLEPVPGSMPDATDPPTGCRFHPRCPDARAVCTENRPDCRTLRDEDAHQAACVKHDAFGDVDYAHSPPLDHADSADRRDQTARDRDAE